MQKQNKTFKELKQKQKAKISEWLYIETFRFYQINQQMPDEAEKQSILDTVYMKISSHSIWISFEELCKYYLKRLNSYHDRILRDIENNVDYPEQIKVPKTDKPKVKKHKRKPKKKADVHDIVFEDDMDDNFAFIVGYTDGGAPYGVMWEDIGIPSDLPFDIKKDLYRSSFK